ncbi:MAG: HipA domain-containing protein [Nocardioidaceae bacterium]
MPGAFSDCSPDRWGKNLISKTVRVAGLARRPYSPVGKRDRLPARGQRPDPPGCACAFGLRRDGPFLYPDLTVPEIIELPKLLHAADAVARDADDMAAIKELLDAGSGSLGGARPKASVRDGGRLLIAKFPHHNDDWDVMAWEKTALDLAEGAGIDTPHREIISVGGKSVLILDRFDRDQRRRIGYMSAMTMVEGRDGTPGDYLEVAETLTEFDSRTGDDLRQLWRRIAFSIAVHNTDDHLRNHGFLRDGSSGWRLSPVFDVNPNPDVSTQRVTGIGGAHHGEDELRRADDLRRLLSRYRANAARQIIIEVLDATSEWQRVATDNGVAPGELSRFADVFEGQREPLERLTL